MLAQGKTALRDSQWTARPPTRSASLAGWLHAAIPAGSSSVPAATLEHLLASVACGAEDAADAEAWVAPDGRFRLGSLAGTWAKPTAIYIGFAARAEARAQRLAEIATRLDEISLAQAAVKLHFNQLSTARQQAEHEWRSAPQDQPLHKAHTEAAAREREFQQTRSRLAQADALCREAEQATAVARETLLRDAADLRLPAAAAELPAIEEALTQFNDSQYRLVQAVQEWRRALPEWQQQQLRQAQAGQEQAKAQQQLTIARIEAEEAAGRYQVLRDAVGVAVQALRQQLADTRAAVTAADAAHKAATEALRMAGEQRAIASAKAEAADIALQQRLQARGDAVARLQRFAQSSLLSSALPEIELPAGPWTIDPALTLARKAEQALAHLKDDDDSWARVQRQTAEDLQELQRALSALGHQAPAEPSDWGLVVHIVYQNRPERPDRLAARLADEIAQRSELLSAKERAVLENHLQAEIAAEVQRLLQAAEKQVAAVNTELHKRPTSTGVRYRLQWLPLAEADGAPVGLEAARQRLLNTGADLWSAQDRRVVGAMLQQRIQAERERADSGSGSGLGRDAGGSLIEQLARALDYRRWHQFRVQRLQDGQWRKLSGPASSGERALGLTVPLFAAIASFYSQGSYVHAPRLMLLDEAFAGIDDAARAHCMGLIRQFDLDFVITSEREWGCYAELPGVAICQLQRREGVDAVYVSRWAWDGLSKRHEDDPNRRFSLA